ncbi:hypothetical protein AB205_0070270 [Aquarana catesbeiana]|uniref:Uncharacterized protein n=1 Tax=Aquarana catesbeiana TaxID=8400 RepID=A0A2G9S5Y9_AQUCT|nr:hypothetical protein AB205_0070270 [Aquarana catesbeiana]
MKEHKDNEYVQLVHFKSSPDTFIMFLNRVLHFAVSIVAESIAAIDSQANMHFPEASQPTTTPSIFELGFEHKHWIGLESLFISADQTSGVKRVGDDVFGENVLIYCV